jgi:pimeloyl-ACP methyl ester carboxylesterase
MIKRQFVTVTEPKGTRQIHLRWAGNGPPIFLLHQSPMSSAELVPMITELAETFTVFAPDTPGFGLSDPLPDETIDPKHALVPYARSLNLLMETLNIPKAGFYGFHTGAMIAAEMAHSFPQRVAVAISNGFVVLVDKERDYMVSGYFPPVVPQNDGSHLAFVWARMRDQLIFFPWWDKREAARFLIDLPSPEQLMPGILDFLRQSGTGERAYRAAFTADSVAIARETIAPLALIARDGDPIGGHMDQLTELGPAVTRQHFPLQTDLMDFVTATFAKVCGGLDRPASPPIPSGITLAKEMDGGIFTWAAGPREGATVIGIHGPGGSAADLIPLLQPLSSHCRVIMPDLPGHGETDSDVTDLNEIPSGDKPVTLVGIGGGVGEVMTLAARAGARVERIVLVDPWLVENPTARAELAEKMYPNFPARASGGHLLDHWQLLRDTELFWPWYEADRAHALMPPGNLDPVYTHRRTVDLLKAGPASRESARALFARDLIGEIQALPCPVTIGLSANSPFESGAVATKAPIVRLTGGPESWARALGF